MTLTSGQRATLKADIVAKSAAGQPLQALVAAGDWDGVAAYYNATASPSFTVWKSNVSINEVGRNFNATELAGLTTANLTRLQTLAMFLASGVNPSLAGIRQFFDDVFSGAGGALTRAALLILWKRLAFRIEQLFATGTGTDASPAILVLEGVVTAQQLSDTFTS
jgi:hypothetical protein